ncbi:MAG: hypothetical protein ABIW84_10465 [Ilumatobacteraceae bacterium]
MTASMTVSATVFVGVAGTRFVAGIFCGSSGLWCRGRFRFGVVAHTASKLPGAEPLQ